MIDRHSDPLTRRAVGRAIAAAPIMALAARATGASAAPAPLPLIELRRYRTRPGRLDELVELFERQFVESQEAVGMEIIGTFREPGQPNRFTWLRGFADMAARGRGLNDFYDGPVWQAHRDEANPTLEDNDDVLLLRESRPGSGFAPDTSPRAAPGAPPVPRGVVTATICWLKDADDAGFATAFETGWRPRLAAAGVPVLASFAREKAANTFRRLPVREGEEVFVWFSKFRDAAACERAAPQLAESGVDDRLSRSPEVLRLEPTVRSRLHW